MTISEEGARRALKAIDELPETCHLTADPECDECVREVLVEGMLLLLNKHQGEAYTGWGQSDYKRLQDIADFLLAR